MARAIALAVFLVTSLSLVAIPATVQARDPELVTLCHKPGTTRQRTLRLPQSATEAHLRHGDTQGACQPPPGTFNCPVARILAGPPRQAVLTFQETTPALLSLTVNQATNATVDIPPFSPDTSDPVVVTATKIDQSQAATVVILVRLETESTSTGRFCTTAF
jgi:hypothetical protein